MGENDSAQNFTIEGGSSAEGIVNNITENLNGVNLNDNPEQRSPQSNLENPTENKMELTTATELTASKRTTVMVSSWMKNNSGDVGLTSTGIVQNNTSSEKTYIVGETEKSKEVNTNEYDIIEEENNSKEVSKNEDDITEEGKNSKEINPNVYDIAEEGNNSKEVNLKKYDNNEKENTFIKPKIFIGRDIYKEFEGVKSRGTVITYFTSLKLFEVLYKNDNRMEYLNHNEVLSHLAEKDKIYEVQRVESPSNILEKTIETEMEEVALGEHVNSKRKIKDISIMAGKSSSKKRKTSSGPSSRKAINIKQTGVTPPPKENAKTRKNENSKSACKFTKKNPERKCKPWHVKRENASKEEPYEPYQFRGLYICKEINGIRSLGTVVGYSPEMNKLIIQYKTDDSKEYMTQMETLRSMAKRADIMTSPSASGPEKKTDKKKKNYDIGKASTSGTK